METGNSYSSAYARAIHSAHARVIGANPSGQGVSFSGWSSREEANTNGDETATNPSTWNSRAASSNVHIPARLVCNGVLFPTSRGLVLFSAARWNTYLASRMA